MFGEAVPDAVPEPVLMALRAECYDLIWQGAKMHEFRRARKARNWTLERTVEEIDLWMPGGHSG